MNKFHITTGLMLWSLSMAQGARMEAAPYELTKTLHANAGMPLMRGGDYDLSAAFGESAATGHLTAGDIDLYPGYFGGGRLGGGLAIQILRTRVAPDARLFYQESLQVGVPLTAPIVVDFSEQMDASTLAAGVQVIRLRDHEGSVRQDVVAIHTTLDAELQQLTITPQTAWDGNSIYDLVINGRIQSLSGYSVDAETHVYFQTALDPAQKNVLEHPMNVSWAPPTAPTAATQGLSMDIPNASLRDFAAVLSSRDPQASPLHVDPSILEEATRKAKASSAYHIPLSLREIVAYDLNGNVMPALSKPMVVVLTSGLQSSVAPASGMIRPHTLSIWALDQQHRLWVKLPGSQVSADGTSVRATVSKLSVFAVMGAPSPLTSDVYVYPNPWRPHGPQAGTQPGQTGTEAGGMTFTHLPSECRIRIYTVSGDLVRELIHSDLSGSLGYETWDGRTSGGDTVASGVYLWRVESGSDSKNGKLMIIR